MGAWVQTLALVACVRSSDSPEPSPAPPDPGPPQPVWIEADPSTTLRPPTPKPQAVPSPMVGTDQSRERAKQLYAEGLAKFEAGDARAAAERFGEAYVLVPLPALLFNIARCHEQLGDMPAACLSYRAVASDPASNDDMRAVSEARVVALGC